MEMSGAGEDVDDSNGQGQEEPDWEEHHESPGEGEVGVYRREAGKKGQREQKSEQKGGGGGHYDEYAEHPEWIQTREDEGHTTQSCGETAADYTQTDPTHSPHTVQMTKLFATCNRSQAILCCHSMSFEVYRMTHSFAA